MKPLLEYTEDNLKLVSDSIRLNLTVDLLPRHMRYRNATGGSNGTYGHCHTASGVLYKVFGPDNMHLYRALDDENLFHWWIMDKNGITIDLTVEQYILLNRTPPYANGTKAGLLGFEYKKRVLTLLDRVRKELII